MADFSVKGVDYKSTKLHPTKQLLVTKRLGRLVPSLKEAVDVAKSLGMSGVGDGKTVSEDQIKALMPAAKPVFDAFADMPDDDVMFIVNSCFSVVERKNEDGRGWAKLVNASGDMMFGQPSMVEMMAITWFVVRDSINLDELFSLTSAETPK